MEAIETLNARLVDYFGLETNTGRPMFRIVWSDDQTERRLVECSDADIRFLFPEVREVKKYPYLPHVFILERLVAVPEMNQVDLPADKTSYEPIWAYRDAAGNSLAPKWEATQFIIDALYAALGKRSMAKYVDSEENTTVEGRSQRIEKLARELFENETEVGDAMSYGEAIVVPHNYQKES